MKSFHNKIKGLDESPLSGGALFMETAGQEITKEIFANIEISHFENELKFNSHDVLHNYWSSYNLYDKTIENKFVNESKKHFSEHSFFITTKRVIGIKAVKKVLH